MKNAAGTRSRLVAGLFCKELCFAENFSNPSIGIVRAELENSLAHGKRSLTSEVFGDIPGMSKAWS